MGFLILRSLPLGDGADEGYCNEVREHLHQRFEDILHVAERTQGLYPDA